MAEDRSGVMVVRELPYPPCISLSLISVMWIVSPSETFVTVPATLRIAAWAVMVLINIDKPVIRNNAMNVLKRNDFGRIILNFRF